VSIVHSDDPFTLKGKWLTHAEKKTSERFMRRLRLGQVGAERLPVLVGARAPQSVQLASGYGN